MLFAGSKSTSSRARSIAPWSSSAVKCETPDLLPCVFAPPRSSNETSSFVTVLITSGPVMNMWAVLSTMITKSVIAGEYTAPPAHGPMITLICGTTPLALTFLKKISAYEPRLATPS